MTPLFSSTVQGPGRHKPRKKQVATIAQKVVDANHTHEQRRLLIPSANPRTTTLRTLLKGHIPDGPPGSDGRVGTRSQARLERGDLLLDLLCSRDAHLVFYDILV